ADGDAISLGPVVFNFAGLQIAEEGTDSSTSPDTGGSTRIVSASDVASRRSKNKSPALAPEGAGEQELQALSRSSTRTIQAVQSPRKSQPGAKALPSGAGGSRSSNGALAAQSSAGMRRERSSGEKPAAAGMQLSAAERARIRRSSAGP